MIVYDLKYSSWPPHIINAHGKKYYITRVLKLMYLVVNFTLSSSFSLSVYVFEKFSSTTSERLKSYWFKRSMFIDANGKVQIIYKNYLLLDLYSKAD